VDDRAPTTAYKAKGGTVTCASNAYTACDKHDLDQLFDSWH
jgi:hypothetical protein